MGLFTKNTLVGLEIDDCEARAVELQVSGEKKTLINWGRISIEKGSVRDGMIIKYEKVGEALASLWKEVGFKTRDVVVGVSNQGVLVRFANFPKMPEKKLDKLIRFQSQDYLPLPLDTIEFDYSIVGEVTDEDRSAYLVLLVGAKKEMILNYIKALRHGGLQPFDIEVSPLSLLRLLTEQERRDVVALVDISYGLSNILIAEYGVPKLARMVQSSMINAAQLSACSVEDLLDGRKELLPETLQNWTEVLAGEIHTSLGYYLGQPNSQNVDKVIISGRGASFEGLAVSLEEMLGLSVELINPFKQIRISSSQEEALRERLQNFALSTSLASRGLEV